MQSVHIRLSFTKISRKIPCTLVWIDSNVGFEHKFRGPGNKFVAYNK